MAWQLPDAGQQLGDVQEANQQQGGHDAQHQEHDLGSGIGGLVLHLVGLAVDEDAVAALAIACAVAP